MKSTHPITVAYDDACESCIAGMRLLQKIDRVGRLRLVGLSDVSTVRALARIPKECLLKRLHVVDRRGNVRIGSQAVAYLLRQWPLTWTLGLLLCVPGIRKVAAMLYDAFAKRRKQKEFGRF